MLDQFIADPKGVAKASPKEVKAAIAEATDTDLLKAARTAADGAGLTVLGIKIQARLAALSTASCPACGRDGVPLQSGKYAVHLPPGGSSDDGACRMSREMAAAAGGVVPVAVSVPAVDAVDVEVGDEPIEEAGTAEQEPPAYCDTSSTSAAAEALGLGLEIVHDIGGRESQEDAWAVVPVVGAILAVVCDGMGSNRFNTEAGGDASRAAVAAVVAAMQDPVPGLDVATQLRAALAAAHAAVRGVTRDGGTTCTVAYIEWGSVTIAHIGDSSAWGCDEHERWHLLTERHGFRNILEWGLGNSRDWTPEAVAEHIHIARAKLGRGILLCSDGLTPDDPDDPRMKTMIPPARWGELEADEVLAETLAHAREAGSRDNATGILIYPLAAEKPETAPCPVCGVDAPVSLDERGNGTRVGPHMQYDLTPCGIGPGIWAGGTNRDTGAVPVIRGPAARDATEGARLLAIPPRPDGWKVSDLAPAQVIWALDQVDVTLIATGMSEFHRAQWDAGGYLEETLWRVAAHHQPAGEALVAVGLLERSPDVEKYTTPDGDLLTALTGYLDLVRDGETPPCLGLRWRLGQEDARRFPDPDALRRAVVRARRLEAPILDALMELVARLPLAHEPVEPTPKLWVDRLWLESLTGDDVAHIEEAIAALSPRQAEILPRIGVAQKSWRMARRELDADGLVEPGRPIEDDAPLLLIALAQERAREKPRGYMLDEITAALETLAKGDRLDNRKSAWEPTEAWCRCPLCNRHPHVWTRHDGASVVAPHGRDCPASYRTLVDLSAEHGTIKARAGDVPEAKGATDPVVCACGAVLPAVFTGAVPATVTVEDHDRPDGRRCALTQWVEARPRPEEREIMGDEAESTAVAEDLEGGKPDDGISMSCPIPSCGANVHASWDGERLTLGTHPGANGGPCPMVVVPQKYWPEGVDVKCEPEEPEEPMTKDAFIDQLKADAEEQGRGADVVDRFEAAAMAHGCTAIDDEDPIDAAERYMAAAILHAGPHPPPEILALAATIAPEHFTEEGGYTRGQVLTFRSAWELGISEAVALEAGNTGSRPILVGSLPEPAFNFPMDGTEPHAGLWVLEMTPRPGSGSHAVWNRIPRPVEKMGENIPDTITRAQAAAYLARLGPERMVEVVTGIVRPVVDAGTPGEWDEIESLKLQLREATRSADEWKARYIAREMDEDDVALSDYRQMILDIEAEIERVSRMADIPFDEEETTGQQVIDLLRRVGREKVRSIKAQVMEAGGVNPEVIVTAAVTREQARELGALLYLDGAVRIVVVEKNAARGRAS